MLLELSSFGNHPESTGGYPIDSEIFESLSSLRFALLVCHANDYIFVADTIPLAPGIND
jgi:hypothetical protein